MNPASPFVSGFASIVGRPSAGKSTLLNAVLGTKVSIVADKPQTTRSAVQGVWTTPASQVIFVDTPGIHRSDSLFNRKMMSDVRVALDARDLILFLVDGSRPFEEEDAHAVDMIRKQETPVFLVLNKIDRVLEKARLLPILEQYKNAFDFAQYFAISALRGQGLDELRASILKVMPEGPSYFPDGYVTDQPERFMAAELIREKILKETRQEVPHAVAVVVDEFLEKKNLLRIAATIYVEREGQKAIVIGAKGAMLKRVGTLARQEMEHLLGRKIFLELVVKVRENWRDNAEFLSQMDWRTMAGGGPESE